MATARTVVARATAGIALGMEATVDQWADLRAA